MIIHRIPPRATPAPIARPFAEQCQGRFCGWTYEAPGGTPDKRLLRIWQLAHARHWDEEGDEA